MKIEQWKLSDIKPYPGNPRQNDAAVDAVAASIREFGFRQPIVVDAEGVIICGHTRYKAAHEAGAGEGAGPRGQGPDAGADQGVPHRRQQDGRAGRRGITNCCRSNCRHLQGMDFDLELLGFSQDDLAKIFDPGVKEGLTDPDEVPEPPDEAITKPATCGFSAITVCSAATAAIPRTSIDCWPAPRSSW